MPRTSRPMQVLPIVLREVEVTDISDITPNMRRLTVAGDELKAGEVDGLARPEFRSEGFDDHVKLVIPPPGVENFDIGTQEEFTFNWNRDALNFSRDYTVRSVDPASNSFTFDVVRHDSGHASDWAFGVNIGDTVHFAGPKICAGITEGIDFHLLIADETALPAVGRWLEEAAPGTRGHIIVEVPTADDIQTIPTEADVDIEWLIRGATPPGESTLLFEAVKELELPTGRTFAWCAGETMTIAPIRRYLRRDLGLPKEDVEVVGYWRKVVTASSDAAPSIPAEVNQGESERQGDAEAAVTSATDLGSVADGGSEGDHDSESSAPEAPVGTLGVIHEVHEMSELLAPIVTRVAVTFGINELIAGGTRTVEAIAADAGIPVDGARVLLTSMSGLGLVEREGNEYRNTPTGAVLTSDGTVEQLTLDDPALLDLFSIVDLLDVLKGGPSARTSRASDQQAESWTALRAADPTLDAAHRSRTLDHVQYVLDLILDLDPIASATSVALTGDAGAEVAATLTRKAPSAGRTIHTPAIASAGGDEPWPTVDCTLILAGLTGRSREEARAGLAHILASSARLVVAEPFTDDAESDDHQAEELVATYATTGHATFTSEEVREILAEVGATEIETVDIGWGFGRFTKVITAAS